MAEAPAIRPLPKIYLTTPQEPGKKEPRSRFPWKVLFFLALGAVLVWLLAFSGLFSLKEIVVDGQASPGVEKALESLRGRNLIFWRLAKTEAELKNLQPGIAQIKIVRGLPHTIKVRVLEREAALIWQSGDQGFLVAQDGVVVGPAPPETQLPPVLDPAGLEVQVGQKLLSPEFVSFVLALTEALPRETGLEIRGLKVGATTFELTVETSGGFQAIFATDQPLESQMRALKEVLARAAGQIREYVELRVPGKVYYQ